MCWSMPHVWRGKGNTYISGVAGGGTKKMRRKWGYFCTSARVARRERWRSARIIREGLSLASSLRAFTLSHFFGSPLSLSLTFFSSPPLWPSFKFHFLALSVFFDLCLYPFSCSCNKIYRNRIESITNDDWNIYYIRFCGCLFSWYFGRINFVIPFAGLAVKGVQ